ncbi:peptidoglycan-recognition protein SC2 [Tribolium castaneum]|uniref:Peptidoglycan-recognition protein n=1 Tax=Tribolium castaneum TaxID=7070 RepID=D6W6Y5_TRICA|nr:PREDICTED: peptidoglycan-recognition protein SC2 [Tribolium castaneum]EFA11602.1 Peptidoglycan-recognition protein SC2-like Protein [Tribolium castaneum]|eukprot:XP_008193407.1 PREDICTED: peptidoglycan-recognition protein SC2 [Tribolium castaneum]
MFRLVLLLAAWPHLAHSACPTVISRSEWGARAPKSSQPLAQKPAPFVVVHHSDGSNCLSLQACKSRVKGIQNYHIDHNGWQDIGYNFLIGGDGNVYEGRGWGIWGAHVPRYNSKSIGICVIGNFQSTAPTQTQLDALKQLISCAQEGNYVQSDYRLIGHRQGSRTSCPGNQLFNEIGGWTHFDATARP